MSKKIQKKINVETQNGYDLWSNDYDQNPSHTVRCARQALEQLIPDLIGKSILEIGCGTGANLFSLNGKGVLRATGLDFSAGMIAQAEKKHYDFDAKFIQHDVQTPLPIPSGSIDVVLISLVLEHLVDIEFTFSELSRVLTASGRSLVIELHPFRALNGAFARFSDRSDKIEYQMNSQAYSVSELLNAHLLYHLIPIRVIEVSDKGEAIPSIIAIQGRFIREFR